LLVIQTMIVPQMDGPVARIALEEMYGKLIGIILAATQGLLPRNVFIQTMIRKSRIV